MGVLFIVIPEGISVEFGCCGTCGLPIINKSKVDFGSRIYGPNGELAKFGSNVVNVDYGASVKTYLVTGLFYFSAVTCKRCNSKVGDFCAYASEPSEKHKEGNFLLLMHRIKIQNY
eukprot:scpid96893/ scgid33243/ Protein yippee-like 5 &gt; Protein yippee-like 5 &gt; Protein yippee-like 5 &gt; Protein yippee-like 5 &gt; Protein yippee-like 5